MTENGIWTEEYTAHDLWSIEKSLTPMSPEEEREAWAKTVGILDSLCGMADSLLLDPLILALTDAKCRADEELARAEDKLSRPEAPEDALPRERVHPREDERVMRMLRRSDAFCTAFRLIERYAKEECRPGAIDHEVAIMRAAKEEASEEFHTYREEVGVLD